MGLNGKFLQNGTKWRGTDLNDWVVLGLPAAGLLHKLTVNFILQLGMCQAHLQCRLGKWHMVINRGCLHRNVDEQLTGLWKRRSYSKTHTQKLVKVSCCRKDSNFPDRYFPGLVHQMRLLTYRQLINNLERRESILNSYSSFRSYGN